jgi:hypothetical protein
MARDSWTNRIWGRGRRLISLTALERDVLVVACAISAGIHAALTPGHFAESAGAGLGFAVAAALLAGLVVGLTVYPDGAVAVAGAGAILAGLLASYALATTVGLPLLHPEPESVDDLALGTKAIEAVGLLASAHLLSRGRAAIALTAVQPKGRTT